MKKNILIILMILFIALPIFFWSLTLAKGPTWFAHIYDVGRLAALIAFVLAVFQYLFISRIRWIERGIGLDRFLAFHRYFGILILALATIHPFLLLLSEKVQGSSTPIGIIKIIGFITLILVWVTAGAAMVYGKTHISYETWKKVHFAGFFVFPLAFLHSFLIGTTVQRGPMPLFWLVLLLLYLWAIFNRINRRYKLRRNPFTVRTVSKEAEKIWSLHFKGSHKGFSPGQFMLARLVRNGRVSEPHPFTIASEPTEKSLSICVKEVGDFTNAIGGTTSNDTAYIDMPYGVFSFHYHDNERLVFIAGGIGITPFMSMLRDIYARKLKKRVTLLWGIKTEKEIVFRDELDRMASELEGFKVVYVLSRQENWQGEKGRIGRSVLEKHVERFHEGEFFLCGPPSMMKDVKKIIKDLGVSRKRIQTENFALR